MANVNRPTNIKQKEADVNQKLQLYGIYSGMLMCTLMSRVNGHGSCFAKNPALCDHDLRLTSPT